MRGESWLQLGSTAAVVKIIDSYDVYVIVARKLPLQRGMQRTACVLASVFHAASAGCSRAKTTLQCSAEQDESTNQGLCTR